jgi:hypothetical protein
VIDGIAVLALSARVLRAWVVTRPRRCRTLGRMSLVRKRVLAGLLLSYGLGYLGTRHSGILVHKTAESDGDVFHHVAVGAVFHAVPAMRLALFLFFYPGIAAEALTWALMDPAPKHARKEMMVKADHPR